VFAVMVSWRFITAHKRPAVIIALAAALAVAATSMAAVEYVKSADRENPPFLAAKLRGAAETMQVRFGYWGAALKMIADHPLLGVGLDNFGDRYSEYKLPTGREVKRAHNNYVQLAAEMGIPGLVVFCLLWVGLVSAGVPRKQVQHEPPKERKLFYTAAGAGVFAFIIAAVLFNSLETFPGALSIAGIVVLLGLWLGAFVPGAAGPSAGVGLIFPGRDGPRDLRFTRIGIAAGLIAFLAHGIVDFDLYVPGCAQTAWLLAALALVLRERRPEDRVTSVRSGLRWILAAGTVAVCTLLIAPRVGLVTRAFEAESLTVLAKRRLRDFPVTGESAFEAMKMCKKAAHVNPLDDETRYVLAQCYQILWQHRNKRDDHAFHRAVGNFRKAIALAPGHCAALYRIAMLYRDAGIYEKHLLIQHIPGAESRLNTIQLARRRLAQLPAARHWELEDNSINPQFIPYVWAAAETVRSYPTNPHYRVVLGQALRLAGMKDASAEQYARALEYDRLAPIDRLRLSEKNRKLAQDRAAEGK